MLDEAIDEASRKKGVVDAEIGGEGFGSLGLLFRDTKDRECARLGPHEHFHDHDVNMQKSDDGDEYIGNSEHLMPLLG